MGLKVGDYYQTTELVDTLNPAHAKQRTLELELGTLLLCMRPLQVLREQHKL